MASLFNPICEHLGITKEWVASRKLRECLELVETGADGRAHRLIPAAAGHGFHLSFPDGNPWGYQYEPWHWCFADTG